MKVRALLTGVVAFLLFGGLAYAGEPSNMYDDDSIPMRLHEYWSEPEVNKGTSLDPEGFSSQKDDIRTSEAQESVDLYDDDSIPMRLHEQWSVPQK